VLITADEWIAALELVRHPEGGFFRETYRSHEVLTRHCLPARFTGDRALSTAIYYLLKGEDFAALHRVKQDELWHFYDGSSLTIHVVDPTSTYSAMTLGRDLRKGNIPQAVITAGSLFGATVDDKRAYSLVGCTVAPGFDFADFEMPGREPLCQQYPQHRELIERLTR
jgi:predicted cupin superfamily sugar epimerase